MDTQQELPASQLRRPVPMEKHYAIFKSVEVQLKEFLATLDHQYYIAGMRVAYDERDSKSEPFVLPFAVEFGFLGSVDELRECYQFKETNEEEFLENEKYSTIPLKLLEELYAQAKAELEEGAGKTPLKVGVHVVLTGSVDEDYGVECPCSNDRLLQFYYNKTKRKKERCCRGRC